MTKLTKKRNPFVALILSLLVLGLGQLYNGQLHRALVFLAIGVLPTFIILAFPTYLFSFHGVFTIWFGALIYVGFIVYAAFDAFITARRIGEIELYRYNRWYVYVPILVFAMIIHGGTENPVASYHIPSGAMKPTLLVGDYLYVNKSAYRDQMPEYGDVAVFKLPTDNTTSYVKRIVGLPGDRIQILGGILYINNVPVRRESAGLHPVTKKSGGVREMPRYIEVLPNGKKHFILEESDNSQTDNTQIYTVPERHVFGLGDNRDNSHDSRDLNSVGFIPVENLIGRAIVFYSSLIEPVNWWQFWRIPQAMRFDRIGKMVE